MERATRYRHRHIVPPLLSGLTAFIPVGLATLGLGMGLYHYIEGLPWPDAFLNAAMLLGGMGPVAPIATAAGKWLIGGYALLAGIVFLALAATMLSPVFHHLLQRVRIDVD